MKDYVWILTMLLLALGLNACGTRAETSTGAIGNASAPTNTVSCGNIYEQPTVLTGTPTSTPMPISGCQAVKATDQAQLSKARTSQAQELIKKSSAEPSATTCASRRAPTPRSTSTPTAPPLPCGSL